MSYLPPSFKNQHRVVWLFAAIATSYTFTACQTTSSTLTPNQIAEFTKPATAIIDKQIEAKVSLPTPEFDTDKLQKDLAEKINKGDIKSQDEARQFVVEQMLTDLSRYMKPGEVIRNTIKLNFTGTGIAVAENTFVTADHVSSKDNPQLRDSIARIAFKRTIENNCTKGIQTLRSTQIDPTQWQNACIDGMAKYSANNLKIEEIKADLFVWMQPAQPGQGNSGKRILAEVIKAGESVPGKDVSLLKVPGENLPTVPLGDDKAITTGDTVYSNGFPGNILKLFAESKQGLTLPESVFTSGTINAIRNIDGGTVFQTNVDIQKGNSGGGIFNTKAEIVGTVSFASTDEDGKPIPGSNFLTPISVTKQQLKEAGITPQLTPITERYRHAITLLHQKKARKALKEFQQIRDLNPDFPYIQAKISEAQKLVPEDKSLPDWAYPAFAVLAIGGIGGYLWTKRNPNSSNPSKPKIVTQLNALFHRSNSTQDAQNSKVTHHTQDNDR